MQIVKLAHYSIRSFDLEKYRGFFLRGVGFYKGKRPPIEF